MLAGRKVLIVDDDVRNIFALTSALECYNMKVVHAENGQEGIELLQATPGIEAVLMDIMMPEMDGYEAITAIRKMDDFKQLPIIALTAKAMKADRDHCLEVAHQTISPNRWTSINCSRCCESGCIDRMKAIVTESEAASNRINILMVDDSRHQSAGAGIHSEAPDRNLVRASSGEDALRYLLDNEAAVVLLDVYHARNRWVGNGRADSQPRKIARHSNHFSYCEHHRLSHLEPRLFAGRG